MKFLKLLFLLLTVSCGPVYAQIQLGTNFQVNTALPIDSRMSVADLTARDAIPALVRWEGLITYVVAEDTHFTLIGGITNGEWVELGAGGGGGGGLDKWATATEYTADVSVIWEPLSLKIYVANTTHTSAGTFAADIANWDELSNPFSATNLSITGNSLISTDTDGDIILAPNGVGEVVVSSPTNVENVRVAGNAISVIDTNGNLSITANGTGEVNIDAYAVNLNKVSIDESTAIIFPNEVDAALQLSGNGTGTIQLNSVTEVENFIFDSDEIQAAATNSDINFVPNGTGDLKVTYGTNELSLDPSRSDDNLLRNGDFENGIVEYACTDATGAIVASTIPMQNSAQMFQMTVTGAGGYCDFTATTDAKFEGLLFKIGGLFQTELTDVEYCTLVNGAEDNCIPVAAIADDATDPFTQPLRTQSQAGATSVGIRVKTTASTSGVVNFDKLKAVIGELSTGSAISCNGDLDCENVFSAQINFSGVVSGENVDWIDGNCTGTTLKTCNYVSGTFQVKPSCTALLLEGNATGVSVREDTSSNENVFAVEFFGVNGALENMGFSLVCQKAAPDFKTITQQGVVNVGQADGASLFVYKEASQTVTATNTVMDMDSSVDWDEKMVSWDNATDSMTALKPFLGLFNFSAGIEAGTVAYINVDVQVDRGSGFLTEKGGCASGSNTSSRGFIACSRQLQLKSGDKVRIVAATAGGTSNLIYRSLTVTQQVDQQTIVGAIRGVGINQTWQDVTASRSLSTPYVNDTDRPISVAVSSNPFTNITGTITITVDGVLVARTSIQDTLTNEITANAIVPSGSTYTVTLTNATVQVWAELRGN